MSGENPSPDIRSLNRDYLAHDPIQCEYFWNTFIWLIDGTLTGTLTLHKGALGCNKNERVLFKSPEMEPRYHIQSSAIPRKPHFFGGVESYPFAGDTVNVF